MANENLKNALEKAGLTPEEFAEALRVDPKSVQRWVNGATTPYPRHRAAMSRALNLTEHDLWPNETAAEDRRGNKHEDENRDERRTADASDVIGAWAYADDPTTPDLVALITDTTGPVDVLDSCCGIEITKQLTDALLAQAGAGRPVRILTDGSAPHWEPLLDHPQIKLYLSEIPGEYWLIKTPDRMLLTLNLDHQPGDQPPPILELTATASNGLFHRLASKFDELWEHTDETEPIDASPLPGSQATERETNTGPDASSKTGRRRWPRQPD